MDRCESKFALLTDDLFKQVTIRELKANDICKFRENMIKETACGRWFLRMPGISTPITFLPSSRELQSSFFIFRERFEHYVPALVTWHKCTGVRGPNPWELQYDDVRPLKRFMISTYIEHGYHCIYKHDDPILVLTPAGRDQWKKRCIMLKLVEKHWDSIMDKLYKTPQGLMIHRGIRIVCNT
jgi:hypothetical protein